MTNRFQIETRDNYLRVNIKWRAGVFVPLIATLCGLCLACFFASMAVYHHLVWAVWLPLVCYSYSAYWLNSTVVDVSPQEIRVGGEPVPFPYPTRRVVNVSDLRRLFVQEYQTHHPEMVSVVNHRLLLELHDGKRFELLDTKYSTASELRIVEDKIKEFLGIEDAP